MCVHKGECTIGRCTNANDNKRADRCIDPSKNRGDIEFRKLLAPGSVLRTAGRSRIGIGDPGGGGPSGCGACSPSAAEETPELPTGSDVPDDRTLGADWAHKDRVPDCCRVP